VHARTRNTPQRGDRPTGLRGLGRGRHGQPAIPLAPDVVHSAPGNNSLSGEYNGVDDILAYYGKLFERSNGTFTAELKRVKVEGDDTAVATHHDKAERDDKTLDQDETLTFTISGGKITRIVEKHSDPAPYDTFWS
jgi:uncharacterized protein